MVLDPKFLEADANEVAEQARIDRDAEIASLIAASRDPYDQLPLPIRLRYSKAEYAWLTDAHKAAIVQIECDPEY